MKERQENGVYKELERIAGFGVSLIENEVYFLTAVLDAAECTLKLYGDDRKKTAKEIKMNRIPWKGNAFEARISKSELELYQGYRYEALGREFIDPYAAKVTGRESFGEIGDELLGSWDFSSFDWEEDQQLLYSYSDLILYQLHVRGFTKGTHSGVKHKGTFLGVSEKAAYLNELGINAVLLMPCNEFNEIRDRHDFYCFVPEYTNEYAAMKMFPGKNVRNDQTEINYWGYTEEGYYFAPKASYAANPLEASQEMKQMVKTLHAHGIEVFMDMNFPDHRSPAFITDCLHFWVEQYHIDGFKIKTSVSTEILLGKDPFLKHTKLISYNWDINQIYTKENLPRYKNIGKLNSAFASDIRRFLKGDEEQTAKFVSQIKEASEKNGVINFITGHNGFTLADLYSYDVRHNEANKEGNRDGTEYNYSWNCGVEGPTKKKKVKDLRIRMTQNALILLFFAQGTPMLLAGDEFGNSQNGNNNAYCQDNETGWLNWEQKKSHRWLYDFVKQLIAFRKKHPVFHNPNLLRGTDYASCGCPDISFHGVKMWYPDYSNYSRTIGVLLNGIYAKIKQREDDISCYLICNMHWESHKFDLPHPIKGMKWEVFLDTGQSLKEGTIITKDEITLIPRSVVLLVSNRGKEIR